MNDKSADAAEDFEIGTTKAGVLGPIAMPSVWADPTRDFASTPQLNRVWVIIRDNYSEGLGEPFAAYRDKLSAERAMKLLGNAEGTFRCVEIEVW